MNVNHLLGFRSKQNIEEQSLSRQMSVDVFVLIP